MTKFFLSLFVAILAFSDMALACTTACTPEIPGVGPVIVKSFDWDNRDGLVFLNPSGLAKVAIGVKDPMGWKVKHANVTFNQWGINMPLGGMNDKGLVVEIMKVGDFKKKASAKNDYPDPKKQGERRAINQIQWVQYILDTADSLDAAIGQASVVYAVASFSIPWPKAVEEMKLSDLYSQKKLFDIDPVHYLVCDAQAQCRIFEYRDKKLLISNVHAWEGISKKDFPLGSLPFGSDTLDPDKKSINLPLAPVLANNFAETDAICLGTYALLPEGQQCEEQSTCYEACGKISSKTKDSAKSSRRFIMAAAKARPPAAVNDEKSAVNYAFNVMAKEVSNSDTRWQIVYLPKLLHAYWRTVDGNKDPEKVKTAHKGRGFVKLNPGSSMECGPLKKIEVLDLDGSVAGKPYKAISYPSLTFPTLEAINSKALYLNFRHSRFKLPDTSFKTPLGISVPLKGEDADNYRATGLSAAALGSQVCKP